MKSDVSNISMFLWPRTDFRIKCNNENWTLRGWFSLLVHHFCACCHLSSSYNHPLFWQVETAVCVLYNRLSTLSWRRWWKKDYKKLLFMLNCQWTTLSVFVALKMWQHIRGASHLLPCEKRRLAGLRALPFTKPHTHTHAHTLADQRSWPSVPPQWRWIGVWRE